MAAKVRQWKGAWWVFVHHQGKRRVRRVGPSRTDKRRAERIAEQVNAALIAGIYNPDEPEPVPCDAALRQWLKTYAPTLKPGTHALADQVIESHLVPHFRDRDLRRLQEEDLLGYVRAKLDAGRGARTIRNDLSILRRVVNLLKRGGRLERNPAERIGELMRRVGQAGAEETTEVRAWSRAEIETLLDLAREHEGRFAPLLHLLVATGMRRGEALGLQWADVDLEAGELAVRRSVTAHGVGTPKSGRSRRVRLTPELAEELFDLRARRHREALQKGWAELPAWVFCSETGTMPSPRNVERVWYRVRRRAVRKGVRPLPLHAARHSWASLALSAGRSVKWVADQLGHADPALTLRVYAHLMPSEERDLSFASFGPTATARHNQTAPDGTGPGEGDSVDDPSAREYWHAGRDSNPRPPGSKPAQGARNTCGIARRSLSEPYGAGVGVPEGTPWAPVVAIPPGISG